MEVILSLWNIPEKTIVLVWGFRLANKKLNAWNWKAEFEVKTIVGEVMVKWAAQWALYIWWNRTDSMTSSFSQDKCWPSDDLFISRNTRALRFILKHSAKQLIFKKSQASDSSCSARIIWNITDLYVSFCMGRPQFALDDYKMNLGNQKFFLKSSTASYVIPTDLWNWTFYLYPTRPLYSTLTAQ